MEFAGENCEKRVAILCSVRYKKSVNCTTLSREELLTLVERTSAQLQTKESRIRELEARVKWFERQLFGRKSERRLSPGSSDAQLCLGSTLEEEKTPPEAQTVREYQRRLKPPLPDALKSGDGETLLRFSDTVPVKTIEVTNPELEGLEEGKDYTVVREEVTHRLGQKPSSYVVLRYVRKVVKLHGEKKLSSPPVPAALFERSFSDVSLVAGVLVDKFLYHLPLYRQHQRISSAGITISRQTLTNIGARGIELLEPIYYAQLSSVLSSKTLTMDETPIKAGREKPEKLHQGYFWPLYGDKDEVCFPYGQTRGLKEAREILGAFSGTLLTDGYQVYDRWVESVKNVIHAQCWAHTRRKFIEAEELEPERTKRALSSIRRLYDAEERVRGETEGGVLQERRTVSLPVVDELFLSLRHEMAELTLLPSNPFTKAASYALKREEGLRVYLSDASVPIDTNHLERALRVVPMGRKNWLFCWTELGAHLVGKVQSLIVTCRLHGVDPYTYLVDVLKRVGSHPAREVHELTPRLWKENFAKNPLTSDL